MNTDPTPCGNDGPPTRTAGGPGRAVFRIAMWAFTVVIACGALVLWTMREYTDQLSPARAAARRVRWGLPIDRQETIETLLQASAEEIDVALPAVLKLQSTAGPEEQPRLLAGMTNLFIDRLTSRRLGSPLIAFEVAASMAQSVVDTLCAALQSPDDATRAAAAKALRLALPLALLRQTDRFVLGSVKGQADAVDTDAPIRRTRERAGGPPDRCAQGSHPGSRKTRPALDRESPSALRAALRDPSPGVRNEAAVAVASFRKGLDPCLPDLFQIMKENCKENSLARAELEAAMTVGRIRSVLAPCLLDLFRLAPIEWLVQARRVAFTDANSRCLEAVDAGKGRSTVKSMPVLTEALGSPCWEVRGTAAALLGRLGPEAAAALPGLVAALKQPLHDVHAYHSYLERLEIVTALRKIDPEGKVIRREVLPVLERALAAGDWRPQDYAVMALRDLGPVAEPAVPALLDVIKQKSQPDRFRNSAAWALVQIAKGTSSIGRVRAALKEAFKNGLISQDVALDLKDQDRPVQVVKGSK